MSPNLRLSPPNYQGIGMINMEGWDAQLMMVGDQSAAFLNRKAWISGFIK